MDKSKDVWRDKQQSYFQEKKKGEINEIRNMLNNVINEPDDKKGRQIIKKVIGYMTLGLDASSIFSEMCRASYTNDEIQKKMIYFYLTTYAEENPELSIMAINTFKKDCNHTSPKIKGMALRNLCNFKTVDYADNVLPILREALTDHEPYVKKTAVFGCLKLFYFDADAILGDEQILSKLSALIKDPDAIVSFNALLALNEIKLSEGGIPMSPKLTMYLLNRLNEYNQWGQTTILEFVYKYTPKDEKELFDILNILESRLKNSCTALVFSAVKIFLKYTIDKENLFAQVIERVKSPLLTLMTSNYNNGTFETIYVTLEHILDVILNMKGKSSFEGDFKYFYFRADEPTYIKETKLKILTELASENNLGDMLNEINEYALDPDTQTSRKAVQALTTIALKLRDVTRALMKNLFQFYKSNKPHLVNEAVISFQAILRKCPKEFSEIKDFLINQKDLINEPESIEALVWILGSFGEHIKSAPYIIESIVGSSEEFQNHPINVQTTLLTSVVCLFFKKAPETYKIMRLVFNYIFSNEHINVDLKDRASFYYRSMESNIQEVRKGFGEVRQDLAISAPKTNKMKCNIDEFNTLSLVYQKPEHKFIKPYEHFVAMRPGREATDNPVENQETEAEQIVEIEGDGTLQPEDLLEEGQYEMTQEIFESTWEDMQQVCELSKSTQNEEYITEENMEELFKMWRIYNMASAEEDNVLKLYLYSKHKNGVVACFELTIERGRRSLVLTVKCPRQQLGSLYSSYIEEFLRINEIIQ